jgi:hypothetical protein
MSNCAESRRGGGYGNYEKSWDVFKRQSDARRTNQVILKSGGEMRIMKRDKGDQIPDIN